MMKSTRLAAIAALMAGTMGWAVTASAEDVMFGTGGYARGGQGLRTMKVMKVMDKDGDHMISKAEFMKMHEAMFDKMDKNHDGMISTDEWLERQSKSDGS